MGNHRFQRVPPTEKRGRVQTSSITVSVLNQSEIKFQKIQIDPNDVEVSYTRSRGNGGQKVNKTESCVILNHIPSGIIIRSEGQRNRSQNDYQAWELLRQKLQDIYNQKKSEELRSQRVMTTHRGEKRRTYRCQDGVVIDHITGKKADLKQVFKGNIDLLHC